MKLPGDSLTNVNAAQVAALGVAAIGGGDCSIDFSAVTRCDTAAVACLLAWTRCAQAQRKRLRLVGLPPDLLSLLRLYGVEHLIEDVAAADLQGAGGATGQIGAG